MHEKLIINADDFGLTGGVNRGIIECHEAGVVTSTTLMVNGPAAESAAELAAAHPDLGVGLHLNLSAGAPILPPDKVPSLVTRDGVFPGKRGAIWRLSVGSWVGPELVEEIAAQVKRCRQLGVEPTHIDSHHHLHAHPYLRHVIVTSSRRLGINKMRAYNPLPLHGGVSSMGLVAAELLCRRRGFTTPDYIIGVEGPDPDQSLKRILPRMMAKAVTRADFVALVKPHLKGKNRTIEVMCHPGYRDKMLDAASSYTKEREDELRSLKSPEFIRMLDESGVAMISYREL